MLMIETIGGRRTQRIKVESAMFADGNLIPDAHSSYADGISPELRWVGAPIGTRAVALVAEDPDASRHAPATHWLLYNLPGHIHHIPAAIPPDGRLLQFHGAEPPEYCSQFPLPYIKAVRVKAGVDLLQYAGGHRTAKGLLLDACVDGSHGGTGSVFDWDLIPADLPLPVVLAGGLTVDNVAEAIRRVRPWAVDVSSGVEREKGIKDAATIAAFIRGARHADV